MRWVYWNITATLTSLELREKLLSGRLWYEWYGKWTKRNLWLFLRILTLTCHHYVIWSLSDMIIIVIILIILICYSRQLTLIICCLMLMFGLLMRSIISTLTLLFLDNNTRVDRTWIRWIVLITTIRCSINRLILSLLLRTCRRRRRTTLIISKHLYRTFDKRFYLSISNVIPMLESIENIWKSINIVLLLVLFFILLQATMKTFLPIMV
jgi:hypothetical protein